MSSGENKQPKENLDIFTGWDSKPENILKCPKCQSDNVEKIKVTASNYFPGGYKCYHCGHENEWSEFFNKKKIEAENFNSWPDKNSWAKQYGPNGELPEGMLPNSTGISQDFISDEEIKKFTKVLKDHFSHKTLQKIVDEIENNNKFNSDVYYDMGIPYPKPYMAAVDKAKDFDEEDENENFDEDEDMEPKEYTKKSPGPESKIYSKISDKELNDDMPITMDEEEYAELYGTKINTGINYSSLIHTGCNEKLSNNKGKKKWEETIAHIKSFVDYVKVLPRVRISPKELIFKDPSGHWFVIEIGFDLKPYSIETIVYNFNNNYYFSLKKTLTVGKDQNTGETNLAYVIQKHPAKKVKQMDLIDWFMVRKAIYLEKFTDKTNIKDLYDPAILNLSTLSPDKEITLEDLKIEEHKNGDYDLIDLDD